MICAKCGTEYEGSQCPKCDGPVIKINNSDYLARRKAYEEKQAKLKRKEVPGKDRTDRIDKTEKKDDPGKKDPDSEQSQKASGENVKASSGINSPIIWISVIGIIAIIILLIYFLRKKK